MSRAKNWCVTLNNYFDPCLGFNEETMNFLGCGLEVGEQGTPHIQGYVQFKKQLRLSAVKKYWPTAHLEIAKGSPKQNVVYCSKEHRYHDHGECLKGPGARNDLLDVKRRIDEGCSINELRESHYSLYIRYQRALVMDREFSLPDRSWETELHIYWGSTGTGKSRKCFEENEDAFWKTRGEWWDGYDGHETVIVDEFYGWIPIDFVLRICDRYPLSVPVKGGFRKFVAKKIIFTSNKPWTEWYPNVTNPSVLSALERRIKSNTEFK